MGYGAHSRMHTFKIERLSLDLPIIVEIVDSREKLEAFLEAIDGDIVEGLATLEKAEVRFYRSRKALAVGRQPTADLGAAIERLVPADSTRGG